VKKPLKYNWYALFLLTFLVMAIFFVALTGWRVGRPDNESGPDSAMAGSAVNGGDESVPSSGSDRIHMDDVTDGQAVFY
jgi:hypothetical protein